MMLKSTKKAKKGKITYTPRLGSLFPLRRIVIVIFNSKSTTEHGHCLNISLFGVMINAEYKGKEKTIKIK